MIPLIFESFFLIPSPNGHPSLFLGVKRRGLSMAMEGRGKQRKVLNSTFHEAMSSPSQSRTCSVPGSVSLRSCLGCLAADRLELLGL